MLDISSYSFKVGERETENSRWVTEDFLGKKKLSRPNLLASHRPLWVEFPEELETFGVEDEYMLGK